MGNRPNAGGWTRHEMSMGLSAATLDALGLKSWKPRCELPGFVAGLSSHDAYSGVHGTHGGRTTPHGERCVPREGCERRASERASSSQAAEIAKGFCLSETACDKPFQKGHCFAVARWLKAGFHPAGKPAGLQTRR